MGRNTVKKDEEIINVDKKSIIKRLTKYMKPYKTQIIQTLILTFIVIGVDLLNPYFMKIAIDDLIEKHQTNQLLKIGILIVIANIISMICFKQRIIIMLKAANEMLVTIRQELYEHIQKLSFDFFDNRPAGKILARVIGDVNSLKQLFESSVTQLLPNIVKMIGALVIMLIIDVKLTLISMITLPFLIVGMYFVEIKGHEKWQVFRQKSSNMNAYIHENFSGIRVVKSFTAEQKSSESFQDLLEEYTDAFIKAIKLSDLFWPMVSLSQGIGMIIVFIYGVNNNISVGTLVAFISFVSMFWQPIMQLSNFYNMLITNIAGSERIFEILDIKPDIVSGKDAFEMPKIKGNVLFSNVSFEYEKDIPILKQINLDIEEGQNIALVGPTGAGKSTIVNLISRFYDVTEGEVRIDGINIKDVTIESMRSQMGIMTQDTFMFSGSIKENIAYGKINATDEEIIKAAKVVRAHDFIIKLEQGYETNVNERGSRLSVGQRQLIAFARALLANPKILILDEATSSIDTQTEKLLQEGIEKLLKGRTSFVIAHRLSTIRKADRILVVDEGGIKEDGTHKQLMENKCQYYELFMSQAVLN